MSANNNQVRVRVVRADAARALRVGARAHRVVLHRISGIDVLCASWAHGAGLGTVHKLSTYQQVSRALALFRRGAVAFIGPDGTRYRAGELPDDITVPGGSVQ